MLQTALAELDVGSVAHKFKLEDFCFDKQLSFIRDEAKFKVACNSRRSGKTIACAADLINTCLIHSNVTCLYIALSRLNAKMILWDELINLNNQFELGCEMNIAELTMTFPNRSKILLSGASDESEIQKFLGKPFKKVYIDEAQSFQDYLKKLIFSILTPSLYDYNGSLSLIGTPSARRHGTFFEAYSKSVGFSNWASHHWTIFDNPHIERKSGKTVQSMVEEDLAVQGLDWQHPTIRRNVFGEWAEDDSALVYSYNNEKNSYTELPKDLRLDYVLGLDFGFEDADAAVLYGYSDKTENLYLIEDGQRKKQTISELAAWIKEFQMRYPIMKIVGDTGGLGKKIVEEIYQRHGILIQAADKARKREFIELMNSDFRKGVIKAHVDSGTVQDWHMLEWDTSKFPYKEDQRLHGYTHRPDAALYAYREARHWMYEEKVTAVTKPEEYANKQVEQYWETLGNEQMLKEKDRNHNPWWGQF